MTNETEEISGELLENILENAGLKLYSIRFITYSQNFTYEISGNSGTHILRVTSDSHRSKTQIAAELQWIDHLRAGGLAACKALTIDGKTISSFETPTDTLHSVVFEKAPGIPVSSQLLTGDLYFAHGALVGKIHRLTRSCPEAVFKNRFEWQSNRLYTTDIQEYLPDSIKHKISDTAQQLICEANTIPKSDKNYGLIHFDLHYNNFFIDQKKLWLFDFDNCSNGYFVNDIAKALWSSVFTYHRASQFKGKNPFFDNPEVDYVLESVWTPFWSGYATENEIDKDWFEQIPLFFELIHLKEFVHHYRRGVPYRSNELREIFAFEQNQIEKRIVPVSFDFTKGKATSTTLSGR